MKQTHLLALDTETSGLDPQRNGILTAFFIHVKFKNGVLIPMPENSLDISIRYDEDNMPKIDKTALKINGINMDTFEGTHTVAEAVKAIIELKNSISPSIKLMPMAHNYAFDNGFLKVMFESVGQNWNDLVSYHAFDTMVLANALKLVGKIDTRLNLTELTSYFNIDDMDNAGQAHEALYDVKACVMVGQKLLELV